MRLLTASLALLLLLAPSLRAEQGKSVQWVSLEKGGKSAAASEKYVFILFYTDWCGYCHKLDATTLKAPSVLSSLDRKFESVRVNAESDEPVVLNGKRMASRELAALWGVEEFPTMVFLNAKGKVVGSFASYVESDVMVKLLGYISSGARERKVSFDSYMGGKG